MARAKNQAPQENLNDPRSYNGLMLARERSMNDLQRYPVMRRVSPLQGLLLEANGGCVLGGKRDKEGNLIIEEEKPRLIG